MTATADALARARAALDRLDFVAARTNCVADRNDTAVLAAAEAAALGPLHGEPITVKDRIDVTGFRCSGGTAIHEQRRPTDDATAIARLRRAGADVIAKTVVSVDSERFGRVMNPHDVSLSPGGSSSGEGATVGSGAVRLGIGSDSGGSIRVPAAWCRVVGMKPSAGLIPVTGHFPWIGERSDGRTVIGPLAGSVDMVLDRYQGAPPDWLDESRRITEAYWDRSERTGRQIRQDLFDWDRFRRRILVATSDVDVIITPTVADTAPLHRAMEVDDYLFCLPASLTGAPAISLPVGDGAVQVIAHRWCDHVAVAAARIIESSLS